MGSLVLLAVHSRAVMFELESGMLSTAASPVYFTKGSFGLLHQSCKIPSLCYFTAWRQLMSLHEEFWGVEGLCWVRVDLPEWGEVTAAHAGPHTEMFSSSLRCHNS